MNLNERQRRFEEAVTALPSVGQEARVAKNFGFSNSARVLEGGLFACTNNLETYSEKLANGNIEPLKRFVLLCVLTFPPQDEVYFAIVINSDIDRFNKGLIKLFGQGEQRNKDLIAAGKKVGSISNNVKFYLTNDGQIYFHNNEFLESLAPASDRDPLDEDCKAKIDSIAFWIWPPSASARRSLLARDFVGYLGDLVGKEKIRELTIAGATEPLGPQMRRMPTAVPVADIEQSVNDLGGYYVNGEIRRFHAALNFLEHKHFVILSGLSGTGKTQLALRYARAVHGIGSNREADPLIFECPVRPEWTDPTGLTGYYDVLTNRYVVPTFLEAVLVATAHRDSPVFVILDEMNLARVEYYLSDVLSCIETGSALSLHSNGVPLEGTNGTSIRAELHLPPNLFIIGTINIDETTNPVSDKVLDRASVIEMSSVDVEGFLNNLSGRDKTLEQACTTARSTLVNVHRSLQEHGLGFGYRVIEEFVRYHAFDSLHLKNVPDEVTDQLLIQKIFVKLRGAEKQRSLLDGLDKLCSKFPRSQAFVRKLVSDLDDFGSFQAMR